MLEVGLCCGSNVIFSLVRLDWFCCSFYDGLIVLCVVIWSWWVVEGVVIVVLIKGFFSFCEDVRKYEIILVFIDMKFVVI